MDIALHQSGELPAYHLAAHDMALVVLPTLGAKISSMRWAGEELLAQNPRKALQAARYAAPYAEFDASGFDECLPTIGPCSYPEFPWAGVEVPDHGEGWSIPWAAQVEGKELHLSMHGVRFPYEFHKWIALPAPGQVRLRYALTNHAPLPFHYVWSAHPLLAPAPGMRIHLPDEAKVWVEFSKHGRLGARWAELDWPRATDAAGQAVDLGLVLPAATQYVEKLYTTRLSEGWCAAHDPASQRYVAMLFSTDEIPYVGLSINMGGWPLDAPGYYNLGLEPCRGYPDRLDEAVTRGACATAQPGETHTWGFDIYAGRAPDMRAEAARLRAAARPKVAA